MFSVSSFADKVFSTSLGVTSNNRAKQSHNWYANDVGGNAAHINKERDRRMEIGQQPKPVP